MLLLRSWISQRAQLLVRSVLPVCLVLASLLLTGQAAQNLRAQELMLSADELSRPPLAARLDEIVASAQREGWGRSVAGLRAAAFAAYERDPASASSWYLLYRWAELFGTLRGQAIANWIKAVEASGGGHPNMASRYDTRPGSLSGEITPQLQRWLVGNVAFSEEFFSVLSPEDQPVEVLGILAKLHTGNAALFAEYASLALAIAVVYDVPPPPDWPHGQVGPHLLSRRLPSSLEAFDYWTRLDRSNTSAHRLRRLPASELKFLVDTSTPFSELKWAQMNVAPPLPQLAKAYEMVRYREDRLTAGRYSWPGKSYSLEAILREGGICVDQAYFAVQVGKARGVPTLLFRGAGLDGRHAWFGFLSTHGWVLDAGRYAEQKYIAGFVRDPQTWRELSDHELLFLSERFRATPLYRLSMLHAEFAAEYLRAGNHPAAIAAAREAVNRDGRNLEGWQTLLAAQTATKLDPRTTEVTLREAMRALARYPDLEVMFDRQLVASLRTRGEVSLANAEEQRLVRKHQAGRADLSLQQLAEVLQRSIKEEDLAARVRTYRRLLEQHGSGAGMDFFDKIVAPFVMHLKQAGEIPAARDALARARRTLRVEKGRQLEAELKRLEGMLQVGSSARK